MNRAIAKVIAGAAVVLSLGAVGQAAEAHVNWSIGIGLPAVGIVAGGPGYYAPAPVYVQQRPVYYAPPPPVYYGPGYYRHHRHNGWR